MSDLRKAVEDFLEEWDYGQRPSVQRDHWAKMTHLRDLRTRLNDLRDALLSEQAEA